MYVDAKPQDKYYDPHSCGCELNEDNDRACGDYCLNRFVVFMMLQANGNQSFHELNYNSR